MTKPVIESGVPVKPYAWEKYPFSKLNVGCSFFVAADPIKVCTAACMYAKRHPGVKLTTRKVDGGCRVWRIT